ncbi:autoinducer 2 sensor kinase/phosphatase luxQ [Setomelanomma holmii]|uniref:Autoinducer 2 sensor kinase/phosphatase luxQ n=1 Tax=Setomelanomma holmii TaxID=210430 RepID=A0A9P4HDA3_9PLEO|nr:autoinducer 2 sensor kinase/phosphatase luxQ [Setomelanomma holmii]
MGGTFIESYPDLWPAIREYFEEARRTGAGINHPSIAPLVVERKGWREETFFSGSFTPVGPPGQPAGFYLLNMLAAVPTQTVDAAFDHILTALETNAYDVPLALLYRFGDSVASTALRLHGHIGLPVGHKLLVESAYIESEEGLVTEMRRAGNEAIFIDYDERFDSASWTGWASPSKKIAVLPISSDVQTYGFVVVGMNPYRPHDAIYQQYVRDLNRTVSSIVSAAIGLESTSRRQEQLEADLAFSDLKLRHLINHASVGMCHASLDGRMLWANDHFYRLAGKSATKHAESFGFLDVYHEEDRAVAIEACEHFLAGRDHITAELRLQRTYETPAGESVPVQIQVLAFPYRDPETGMVKSIMACTTDISRLKWAQTFQARQAAEAREAKRKQEAFIDVVSHEMRNPLSAIVHCADAIASAMEGTGVLDLPLCLEALNDNVQSAKRIIDDILTLSKLDSMLLSITPVAVKPAKLIASIVEIFEAELKSSGIQYGVLPNSSLTSLAIDALLFVPSRVTQFVKTAKVPTITIRFGASVSRPRSLFPDHMFWASTSNKRDTDVTSSLEWDSGIGLQDKDIHKIFERFRQANAKTHVKYGGSGLGLFISKELTEKQGGEIGVTSEVGHGSTFSFYVKMGRIERRLQIMSELFDATGERPSPAIQLQVLLVEDNVINQQVLGKQLRKAGCVVAVANHGLEALEMLEEQVFDIVLMDLEMPILDGVAAMGEIRKRELAGQGLLGIARGSGLRAGSRLPIIAVTANVRQEQIDTAIVAGADRVMQKPFKAADLLFHRAKVQQQLCAITKLRRVS